MPLRASDFKSDVYPGSTTSARAESRPASALKGVEATTRFELVHSGFADRPLNHLGTSPRSWLALLDSNQG
ncbi:MAG: hypothetical protein QOJ81_1278 [Chloroflexota bacterium]|nr:hypothetical protein [Chloroflexota bacterium]